MSNVPHHSSTRDHGHHNSGSSGGGHHSLSSRSSHRHSGFMPALGGGDEAAEQWAKDGVVEPGGILPGTVHGQSLVPGTVSITPFADDIRPVAIVDALPTLPHADYPEFSYVVLTSNERLYKNVNDVWVLGVNGADIVADSITAGQIAAGAISASEIAAEAVTADELQVGLVPGRNFLVNGGFRDGTAGWTFVTGGAPGASFAMTSDPNWVLRDGDVDNWTPTGTNYGSTSRLFGTNTASQFFPNIYQSVPVAPGEYYSASVLLGRHRLTSGYLHLIFYDGSGVSVGGGAQSFAPVSPVGGPDRDDWNYVVINGLIAPAGAQFVNFHIVAQTPNTSGADWYLFIDQAWFGSGRTARPFVPGEPSGIHNSDGNVKIDSTGITINNGKLFINDEFGSSTLGASGPSGSWEEQALTGIRNGSFGDNDTADPAAVGRTANCPYWTLTKMTGTPTLATSAGQLVIRFTTTTHKASFESDLIKVRQGVPLSFYINDYNADDGALHRVVKVKEYRLGGTVLNTTKTIWDASDLGTFSGGRGTARKLKTIIPQAGANLGPPTMFIKIIVEVDCTSGTPNYVCTEVAVLPADSSGTSFPVDVGLEDSVPVYTRFFRTDLGIEFFYDGTQWLSTTLYHYSLSVGDALADYAASQSGAERAAAPWLSGGSDLWLETTVADFLVDSGGSALGASHKWVGTLSSIRDGTATADTYATFNIDSGASSVYRRVTVAINGLLDNGTVHRHFRTAWTKTGTPGNLRVVNVMLAYRIVAT